MTPCKPAAVLLLMAGFICSIIHPCFALDPSWTFSDNDRRIEGILVAPDGSGVIGAAGRVILLSRDGAVLSKEPFGEIITQSRDGSTIVSVYSSTMTSTVYYFSKIPVAGGTAVLQKKWEVAMPSKVRSIALTEKGDRVVFSSGETVNVYDGKTGKYIGSSKEYSSLIAVSARGGTIAGISNTEGFKVYHSSGALKKKYDLVLSGQPENLLMNANGTLVVFNTGPRIIAVNVSDGKELWKRGASGNINSLAMNPSGTTIIAGTNTGTIECYDAEGNQTWKTYADNVTGSSRPVKSVAITSDAAKIIAGTDDGRILFLDPSGNIVSGYNTKDHIGHVATAADGSLSAASGENTIYAFSMEGNAPIVTSGTQYPTRQPYVILTTESSKGMPDTSVTIEDIITTATLPETPKTTITEYSIIKKSTQPSPLNTTTLIFACLAALFFIMHDRR